MSELGSNKPEISTKPGFDRYDCADICALPRPTPHPRVEASDAVKVLYWAEQPLQQRLPQLWSTRPK